jgi:hypothetical protein
MDIALILTLKYPDTLWRLIGEEYKDLEWFDESPKPTKKQLQAKWPEVQYEMACNRIAAERKKLYTSVTDPLFFKYHRGEATEQEWLDSVQAVKDAHPYPDEV